MVTSADPLGNLTRNCYDGIGRVLASISPRGSATGVTCASPAPAAFTTYTSYNAFSQVVSSTAPLGG